MAASAVDYAVLVALVLRDVRLRYVESMRRMMGDTAAFLSAFVAPGSGVADAWSQKLAVLPPNAELFRVFACDGAGRVIYDSARGGDLGQVYRFPMRGGGRAASENYTISNVEEVDGELRVAAPVRHAGEMIGWVGVGRPLKSVAEGVTKAREELIWSLGSIAAVMVAAGWWISTRLTRSLERLTAYTEAVRRGEPAEPPRSRASEIDALGRAFEEMRVALEGKAYIERYTQALTHEFKSPLSAIRGAAELLAENPPEPDRVRFIANLRAETERLRLLVDRLLELAALESRRAGAAMNEIDCGNVVRSVCQDLDGVAALRHVRQSYREGDAVRVRGDAFLLGQAVANLVQNALDFSPPGGVVTVELEAVDTRVTVIVEDTGPGVPAYALEKVFERFYSLPRPDSGRKSSGLGLSIVREIARLHGGTVTLENRVEGGARAVLTLPLA